MPSICTFRSRETGLAAGASSLAQRFLFMPPVAVGRRVYLLSSSAGRLDNHRALDVAVCRLHCALRRPGYVRLSRTPACWRSSSPGTSSSLPLSLLVRGDNAGLQPAVASWNITYCVMTLPRSQPQAPGRSLFCFYSPKYLCGSFVRHAPQMHTQCLSRMQHQAVVITSARALCDY